MFRRLQTYPRNLTSSDILLGDYSFFDLYQSLPCHLITIFTSCRRKGLFESVLVCPDRPLFRASLSLRSEFAVGNGRKAPMSSATPVQHGLIRRVQLPPIPDRLLRIDRVIRDPESGTADIAKVIEGEEVVAASLLKVANAAYGRRHSGGVTSIRQAILQMGLRDLRELCLTISLIRHLTRPSPYLDHQDFWHHSLTVGSAARRLCAERYHHELDSETVFVAGLLHEVGTLVLDQCFPEEYFAIRDEKQNSPDWLWEIEVRSLGVDHAEVGAQLLEWWQFPEAIIAAARWHHEPMQAPSAYRQLCSLIHVVDNACNESAFIGPGESRSDPPDPAAPHLLGLSSIDLDKLASSLAEESRQATTIVQCAS